MTYVHADLGDIISLITFALILISGVVAEKLKKKRQLETKGGSKESEPARPIPSSETKAFALQPKPDKKPEDTAKSFDEIFAALFAPQELDIYIAKPEPVPDWYNPEKPVQKCDTNEALRPFDPPAPERVSYKGQVKLEDMKSKLGDITTKLGDVSVDLGDIRVSLGDVGDAKQTEVKQGGKKRFDPIQRAILLTEILGPPRSRTGVARQKLY
ncbi:MAG: hypothetical protein Kow00107_08200 [Planctomycetota bacterium]